MPASGEQISWQLLDYSILKLAATILKKEFIRMAESEFPKIFPRLETDRLTLRKLSQKDVNAVFKNYSDPDVAKWFFEQPYTDIKQAVQIIDQFNHEFMQGQGITWAIILKDNSTCIGTCGYGEVVIGERGEIGFDLAKEHWNRGLMTEALTAIINYGFEVLDLSIVEAHTYSDNARALHLLE
jgi:ribosomal-protein-alanine N-acetyltransferase